MAHFMESGEPTPTYEFVDLGLPSGTLWANMNIGAKNEYDCGLYFQWGDTIGHESDNASSYSYWDTTPFNNGSYSYDQVYFQRNKTQWLNGVGIAYKQGGGTLKPQYDAAYVASDGVMKMPTVTDINELIDNTTSENVTVNGINLVKFTSKTNPDKYIFFPCGGNYYQGKKVGVNGVYIWSSDQYNDSDSYSMYDHSRDYRGRLRCMNVRGVKK